MRQVWITRKGGPEVLEVREAPDPQPGPDEVRIRVRAAGVNFADLMARRGLYLPSGLALTDGQIDRVAQVLRTLVTH